MPVNDAWGAVNGLALLSPLPESAEQLVGIVGNGLAFVEATPGATATEGIGDGVSDHFGLCKDTTSRLFLHRLLENLWEEDRHLHSDPTPVATEPAIWHYRVSDGLRLIHMLFPVRPVLSRAPVGDGSQARLLRREGFVCPGCHVAIYPKPDQVATQ